MELLQVVGPLIGLVGLAAGYYYFRYGKERKRLVVSVRVSKLIADRVTAIPEKISVAYDSVIVGDPRVVTIELSNTGSKDISSKDFDGEKPLAIEVNCEVMAVLQNESGGIVSTNENRRVLVPPTVMARGKAYTIQVLVDGEPKVSVEPDRLVDTDIWNIEERIMVDKKRKRWAELSVVSSIAVGVAATLLNMAGSFVKGDRKANAAQTAVSDLERISKNLEGASISSGELQVDLGIIASKISRFYSDQLFTPIWAQIASYVAFIAVIIAFFGTWYLQRLNQRITAARSG
ncbi:hypothetical protein AB0B25_31065 [Nocardia sp. NPDC049190]|uniref:hypothetical protein n=1 Tax=Nocardia sp. NPDC049190 TaxID=3155650 RepID=UPI0033DB7FE0